MKNGAAAEACAEAPGTADPGTASKATLTPCTSRTPVVGDRVQGWVPDDMYTAFPLVGETATVVEVDEKGDFRLRKKAAKRVAGFTENISALLKKF